MSYSVIAPLYDRINGDQYAPYAAFLREAFAKFSPIPVREVLDLGCGTGRIAALLADAGFDMVALDMSYDMLAIAREVNADKNTLLLCQDMRAFELYGTVQAAYSSFDCFNYLRSETELKKVFRLLHNYIEPNGLFIFDVNTRYRFEHVYADNTFSYEFEDGLLIWRNEYGEGECTFTLDWFELQEDESYRRYSETQTEYLHAHETLVSLAASCGFEALDVFADTEFGKHEPAEKAYYILKRKA